MVLIDRLCKRWFGPRDRQLGVVIKEAQFRLRAIASRGQTVDLKIISDILNAEKSYLQRDISSSTMASFYEAYAKLSLLIKGIPSIGGGSRQDYADPFEDAINDAEELLRYSAETGVLIDAEVAEPIFAAREAFTATSVTNQIRVDFYASYAKLAKQFGNITAETIRNCGSLETQKILANTKRWAAWLTFLVAVVSIFNFVAGSLSKSMTDEIALGNKDAVELSAGITTQLDLQSTDGSKTLDPCDLIAKKDGNTPIRRGTKEIEQLQQFALNNRDLRNLAVKLNLILFNLECDHYGSCWWFNSEHNADVKRRLASGEIQRSLQLNSEILNPAAEVACKIETLQEVRSFATNVQTNYNVGLGAFISIALPIAYAWLGALAYQLRLFGETIRKRTYHPSFADSARIIAAIIAGAISGLFNPAQGLSLSPLAIAFLIGYGVEIYFKFFDTLLNSFGAGNQATLGLPSNVGLTSVNPGQGAAQIDGSPAVGPVIRALTTEPAALPARSPIGPITFKLNLAGSRLNNVKTVMIVSGGDQFTFPSKSNDSEATCDVSCTPTVAAGAHWDVSVIDGTGAISDPLRDVLKF
jgi:hypothetical protein